MKLEWLEIGKDVKLTPAIERNLPFLDVYFEHLPTIVTSGYRDSRKQLELILRYSKSNGLWSKFDELELYRECDPQVKFRIDNGPSLYWWQRAWSGLLEKGIIINPPLMAECLSDYVRPSGEKMKGKVINPSPHSSGYSIDLSAKTQMKEKSERLAKAKSSGVINSFMVERKQNCLHVDFPHG